jgi:hypothetical protein
MTTNQRHRYEVVPNGKGGRASYRWKVARDGITLGLYSTKAKAIAHAVYSARTLWRNFGELGSLLIKGRDGKIQDERTYGRDPIKTKG